jgi:aromatic-L-amino-acid/L-tryptophan decarboxylase
VADSASRSVGSSPTGVRSTAPDQSDPLSVQLVSYLRDLAAPLDPPAAERGGLYAAVIEHVERHLRALDDIPSFGLAGATAVGAELRDFGIPERPRPISMALELIARVIEAPGVATTSPMHLGYIPSGGLVQAALGDLLAAASNRYAGLVSVSPGAACLEDEVVRWLAQVVGLPAGSGGTLTSGGSMATLTAIHAARVNAGLRGAELPDVSVYLSEHTHMCVEKALDVCGLREVRRRWVDSDASGRMDPGSLKSLVTADLAAGLKPWLVVATAGSTSTGAVDPLGAIAEIAGRLGLWLHVDGAYGGLFALCPDGRSVLDGIQEADSVVVDPHKSLFLPYGTGALLVRDRAMLKSALTAEADYLSSEQSGDVLSPAHHSPELTRHFRALRVWLPLQLAGTQAFSAALSEKIHLARYLRRRLLEHPGFEVGPPPDLSVVTYRYLPQRQDPDAFNLALAQRIQEQGQVFLSTTRLGGRVVLRAAVLSFRTHLEHIDRAVDALTTQADQMNSP